MTPDAFERPASSQEEESKSDQARRSAKSVHNRGEVKRQDRRRKDGRAHVDAFATRLADAPRGTGGGTECPPRVERDLAGNGTKVDEHDDPENRQSVWPGGSPPDRGREYERKAECDRPPYDRQARRRG